MDDAIETRLQPGERVLSRAAFDDYLARALAAEEHRQGLAYGDDPDHCGDCKAAAYLRLQATCEHDGEQADVTGLGDTNRRLLCQRCGLIREVSR